MRDASLDEFLSTDDGAEEPEGEADEDEERADGSGTEQPGSEPEPAPDAGDGAATASGTGSGGAGPPPVDGVEPAVSTFAWSPDGAACDACGERVEERWEGDSGLVCVGCKGW